MLHKEDSVVDLAHEVPGRLKKSPSYIARSLRASKRLLETSENELRPSRAEMITKIIIIALSVGITMYNAVTGVILPSDEVGCIEDKTFEATAGINKYLTENDTARSLLIAFSSMLIDILMVSLFTRFMFFSKRWNIAISLLTFYILRSLVMAMFYMKFPEGYIFGWPGVYSLAVPYAKTRDFFFSGHLGFATIATCEFADMESKWLYRIGVFTIVIEFCVMIVTRGHYVIDLITGIVFGHYISIMTERYGTKFEDYIRTLFRKNL